MVNTRSVLALVFVTSLLSASVAHMQSADPWPPLVARAKDVVARLASGDLEPLIDGFNDKMKAAASADVLRGLMPAIANQIGAFKAAGATHTATRDSLRIVSVTCDFERGSMDIAVVFDGTDRIAGISMRPPTPSAPFVAASYVNTAAFRDEPFTVDAGGWPLPGTLSRPVGNGPFPALVLVHGSGPSDRDASFGPNKMFRDLAEGLASRGIAVVRFDKRTTAHAARIAKLQTFTAKEEVIDDAVAATKQLRATPGVKADHVFVLGHSLGGMLAPRIGAADPAIAGLVVMAGAVRPLEQSIVDQARYLAELDGTITPDEQKQLDANAKFAAEVRALQASSPPVTAPGFAAPASYFIDLRGYSPPDAARTLKQPLLILQGARDYQVTMDDFAAWKRALAARTDVQFESYPTLNHAFMSGSGPSAPAEYGVPGHVDEAVIRDIAQWIARQ